MTTPFDSERRLELENQDRIPHSGSESISPEMRERPSVFHDNTTLDEAIQQGLTGSDSTVYEEIGVIDPHKQTFVPPVGERDTDYFGKAVGQETNRPWYAKPAAKVGAALFAVSGIGAGIAFMGSDSGSENAEYENLNVDMNNTPDVSVKDQADSPDSVIDSGVETESQDSAEYDEGVSSEVGNIDPGFIFANERTITATRQSGETIEVPGLRLEGSPNELASSAMALISCFLTTGEQACLDELTSNADIQQKLVALRATDYPNDGTERQAAFFDKPGNPASFVETDHSAVERRIERDEHFGPLFYNNFDRPSSWQGTEIRNEGITLQVTDMVMVFNKEAGLTFIDWKTE